MDSLRYDDLMVGDWDVLNMTDNLENIFVPDFHSEHFDIFGSSKFLPERLRAE